MDRELFYQKLQPYFEQGLIREVYSSDHVCMLCLGEVCYVACSYYLFDNNPVGIYMRAKTMRDLANTNRLIYPLVREILGNPDEYDSIIYDLNPDCIEEFKKWIAQNRELAISDVDYNLEEELRKINKRKKFKWK